MSFCGRFRKITTNRSIPFVTTNNQYKHPSSLQFYLSTFYLYYYIIIIKLSNTYFRIIFVLAKIKMKRFASRFPRPSRNHLISTPDFQQSIFLVTLSNTVMSEVIYIYMQILLRIINFLSANLTPTTQ